LKRGKKAASQASDSEEGQREQAGQHKVRR
jgi:hypothetical protein